MNKEPGTTSAQVSRPPEENWAEFSRRVDSGRTFSGQVPDCPVLGPVENWLSEDEKAEADRMFAMGKYPRTKRTPRIFRHFGRIGNLT